jgi:hypothetical protein
MIAMDSASRSGSSVHFQLYVAGGSAVGGDVRWRLLSGNNRDMGRSAQGFLDVEDCRLALKEFLCQLNELTPQVRRKSDTNRWIWLLRRGDVAVAEASHSYDRQIRADAARQQFLLNAASASVSASLMISASRRGVRPHSLKELI